MSEWRLLETRQKCRKREGGKMDGRRMEKRGEKEEKDGEKRWKGRKRMEKKVEKEGWRVKVLCALHPIYTM